MAPCPAAAVLSPTLLLYSESWHLAALQRPSDTSSVWRGAEGGSQAFQVFSPLRGTAGDPESM